MVRRGINRRNSISMCPLFIVDVNVYYLESYIAKNALHQFNRVKNRKEEKKNIERALANGWFPLFQSVVSCTLIRQACQWFVAAGICIWK